MMLSYESPIMKTILLTLALFGAASFSLLSSTSATASTDPVRAGACVCAPCKCADCKCAECKCKKCACTECKCTDCKCGGCAK